MIAALLAAVVVLGGHLLGWQGVDTAAQLYRVDSFRHSGFSLWDFGWYGGHWTLDYSVIYPPVAAWVGVLTVTVLSAAAASYAFDRLARHHLGPGGAAASYLFALGTLVPASIGQLTFLAGEALALPAVLAATRRRWALAALLAVATALASPLAGMFLALAGGAWASDRITRSQPGWWPPLALAAAAGVPVLAGAVLFPGDGAMPYPVSDWVWEMVVAAAVGLLAGRRHREVAWGAGLWMVVATIAQLVSSPLGGNVGRLEDALALPLAVGLAWDQVRLLVPVAALPLALSQWGPAWGAFTSAPSAPSTHAAFYTALDRRLDTLAGQGPAGRVEVVPTEYHWEAAYVAPVMPLARGWERQLDEADNPIFYRPGRLDPASYRAWLLDDGVRFVALPSAPLDMAGQAEGRLVASGRVAGLRLVWRSPEWRLYEVEGSPGIVSGPAQLVSAGGMRVVLAARQAGAVTVRIRWTPGWHVAEGSAALADHDDWLRLQVAQPGDVTLSLSPFHA